MSKYIINVSFQTRVNKTTRTLEIAESFGLGLDEKEWTLYDNLELEVKQGDVVYITGQSGSGKSVVLRELQRQMKDEGLSVAELPFIDQQRICASMRASTVEGKNVSPSAAYSDRGELTADLITEPAAPDIVPMKRGTPDEPAKQIQTFTREELESIADNEGIAGLRVIGSNRNENAYRARCCIGDSNHKLRVSNGSQHFRGGNN